MVTKKSWLEKLHTSNDLPKVVKLDPEGAHRWGGETMIVPAPIEVDGIMKKVPKGKIITIDEIRKALARKHQTEIACPLTSGIFAWIAAHAAEEARGNGEHDITPWWRTLKGKGELNPKYPNAFDQQKTMLENEGHKIIQKGKKYFVDNWENKIFEF